MRGFIITGMVLFLFVSCGDNNNGQPEPVDFLWEFAADAEGWTGDIADYPVGEAEAYEFVFSYDSLPAPLDETKGALKLSGNNLSDDLFMFAKKKVSGLEPSTVYYVTFTVEFASNVPDSIPGIGGSPGESVFIKAGATIEEPDKEPDDENMYRMNIDKGNQSQGGDNMVVIGDFSNDTEDEVYALKTVSNESPLNVISDENGEVWIIVGTDSGFEGTTRIYYNSIGADFF